MYLPAIITALVLAVYLPIAASIYKKLCGTFAEDAYRWQLARLLFLLPVLLGSLGLPGGVGATLASLLAPGG